MSEIQGKAKEKVSILLQNYDISYIDYNVKEDEYTINLEKKEKKEEK